MDKIKIIFASLAWLVFVYFFGRHIQIINYILSFVSLLSILIIIFGSVGYIWSNYKVNKEKGKKFKEIIFCGIIIFITAIISYSMVMALTIKYY